MTSFVVKIVNSHAFHRFIVAVIVLAGVVAGVETNPTIMARHGVLLHTLDTVILGIFIVEVLLKMAAHGRRPWRYFADSWNVFDFSIIALCLLPVGGPFASVLRLARALRLLRLVSALPKLQMLIGALLHSLSAMGYVSLLLALLFYIYAVAGIHLFGAGDPEHFGSLGAALLTLFQVVTLDNWSDIVALQVAHTPLAKVAIYFVSFIVLGTMIILNLFIGIIMNSMAEMHDEMAERERAAQRGKATLEEELRDIERELEETRSRLTSLRRKCSAYTHRRNSANAPDVTEHAVS
jgi:voltage-gated sodium channel